MRRMRWIKPRLERNGKGGTGDETEAVLGYRRHLNARGQQYTLTDLKKGMTKPVWNCIMMMMRQPARSAAGTRKKEVNEQ